jgi:hypothetical protein
MPVGGKDGISWASVAPATLNLCATAGGADGRLRVEPQPEEIPFSRRTYPVWCAWFSNAPKHAAFAEGTRLGFPVAGVMRPAYSSRTYNADLAGPVPNATRRGKPQMGVEPDDESAIKQMISEGGPALRPPPSHPSCVAPTRGVVGFAY